MQSPRGTRDILPPEVEAWQRLEAVLRALCRRHGYREIRTPIFEHTEIFSRGVGEATDIVHKEMYTFEDRGGRSLTLRPEGTAPVVRAFLEHGLASEPQPVKFFYVGQPMFRYEKPQAGRYRQHHQFGVELLGGGEATADAEIIALGWELLRELGLTGLDVSLNSIGCPICRPGYRDLLQASLEQGQERLCTDCRRRLVQNPLRVLDCSEEACREVASAAPVMREHLCDACEEHFSRLRRYLERLGIPHRLNERLVRGLDYYTRTVFEFRSGALGAQDQLFGGGRYDGLVELFGGEPTPAVGFGLGMERLAIVLEEAGVLAAEAPDVDCFVASLGDDATEAAVELVRRLRRAGFRVDMDHRGRSLRAQLRFADRYPARFALILGGDELARGVVQVLTMASGDQREVPFAEVEEVLEQAQDVREKSS